MQKLDVPNRENSLAAGLFRGLYLEISPAGSKRWFWKYRKDGKEGRMALGSLKGLVLGLSRKADL
jgi:hypothetical protein